MEPTNALARQVARGLWTIPEQLIDGLIERANRLTSIEEIEEFKQELNRLEAENEK